LSKTVPLILVVDADVSTRDVLREELAGLDAEVVGTSMVRETLLVMLERKVPLAVVNMTLPECSAERLVPALRRIQSDLVVILTTDEHSEELERKARGLGIMLYLPKPIAPGLLGEAIRSAIGLVPRSAGGTDVPGPVGDEVRRVVH
jgi:DNA-binding NtrC family response regulator